MTKSFSALLALTLGTMIATSGDAAIAADQIGETQMCIDSQKIHNTPIIDRKTILVEMRAPRGFKRIDLVSECSGLRDGVGFGYSTSINKLCKQDTLKVLETAGGTCLIDQIVTIDEQEARALLARKR